MANLSDNWKKGPRPQVRPKKLRAPTSKQEEDATRAEDDRAQARNEYNSRTRRLYVALREVSRRTTRASGVPF